MGTDFDQVSPNPFPIVFDIDNQDQALCAPVDIIDNLIFEEEESFFAIVRESSGNNVPVELDPSIARIIIIDDERRPTTEPPTTEEPTDFMPDPMGLYSIPLGMALYITIVFFQWVCIPFHL